MAQYTPKTWAMAAVAGILSPKEREQARQELLDHMEDHMESLLAAGFSPEDAEAHAVYAMGAPEATAKLLRKAHQPILTILLHLCRLLALAAAIFFLVSAADDTYWTQTYWSHVHPLEKARQLQPEDMVYGAEIYTGAECSREIILPQRPDSVTAGDYTLRVEQVHLIHYDRMEAVGVVIRARADLPWRATPTFFGEFLVTDSVPAEASWPSGQMPHLHPLGRRLRDSWFFVIFPASSQADTASLQYRCGDLSFSLDCPLKQEVTP